MWVLLVLMWGSVVTYPTQFESELDCLKAGIQINERLIAARWACKRTV
jgi:hypothetical protein